MHETRFADRETDKMTYRCFCPVRFELSEFTYLAEPWCPALYISCQDRVRLFRRVRHKYIIERNIACSIIYLKSKTAMAPNPTARAAAAILDIRREELKDTLRDDIRKLLKPENGEEKQLPTLLLYDERGLKLFEKITYLDECR